MANLLIPAPRRKPGPTAQAGGGLRGGAHRLRDDPAAESQEDDVKRLTNRLLDAIVTMSARVEAGCVEDYGSYDTPETREEYGAALDAGSWARQELRRRREQTALRAALRRG